MSNPELPLDAAQLRASSLAGGTQEMLFSDDLTALDETVGFRGPTACKAAGISYRQLDYWARTSLVEPTVRGAKGSGSQRLYSFRDLSLIHISEPTRPVCSSRMPSSA